MAILKPIADAAAGSWHGTNPANLFGNLDEDIASSGDVITSGAEADTVKLKIATAVNPAANGLTVEYVLGANGEGIHAVVRLLDGTTIIDSWTHTNVPTVQTPYSQTVTPAQLTGVNPANLYVEFSRVAAAPPDVEDAADFITRRTSPGVFRWFDFDELAQLGPSAVAGNYSDSWRDNFGVTLGTSAGGTGHPVIDPDVKCSGAGSLRFDIPSAGGGNANGAWFANTSADLLTQYGEDSEVYYQYRVRWNAAMASTYFMHYAGGPQYGVKFSDMVNGDQVGGISPSFDGITHWGSSNGSMKVVVQSYSQHRFPACYYFDGAQANYPTNEGYGAFDFKLQNGMPTPFCLYSTMGTVGPADVVPGCWTMAPDEWATIQVGITLGPIVIEGGTGARVFSNSTIKVWAAHENQPSELIIDWGPSSTGYHPLSADQTATDPGAKFGKVYLFPYLTDADPTQAHALCQVWYDELIMATERIPDPGGSYPAWRVGKAMNEAFEIADTAELNGYLWPATKPPFAPVLAVYDTWQIIRGWCGLAQGRGVLWSAGSGGHGMFWPNTVLKIDLMADAPAWQMTRETSTAEAVDLESPWYTDGRPCSNHTYWSLQYLKAEHAHDGHERVLRITDYGTVGVDSSTYVPGTTPYAAGGYMNSYRLDLGDWETHGTFPTVPSMLSAVLPIVTDPATGNVYIARDDSIYKWTASTNGAWSLFASPFITPPTYPTAGFLRGASAYSMCFDSSRNRLVILTDNGGPPRLQMVSIATPTVTELIISGGPSNLAAQFIYSGITYDPDNDRYLVCHTFDGIVYAIHPTFGTVTTVCTTLVGSVTVPVNGVFNRFVYISELGGVAYVPNYENNVVFIPTR